MPQALNVQISHGLGGATYNLLAENVSHQFTRMPSQAGLPSESDGTDPNVLLLDLGICIQQISVSGIVNSEGTTSPSTPTKTEFETIVKTWFKTTANKGDLMTITISGSTYSGAIRTANFRQTAGQEDRWDFEITFLVGGW